MNLFSRCSVLAALLMASILTACAQTAWTSTSGTITTSGAITSAGSGTLSISNGGWTMMCADASGRVFSCGGSQDMETRSLKTPGITLIQVKQSRHAVPKTVLASESYLKLAKTISLKSPAVDSALMAEILADHGFLVYDYDKVDSYLYHAALKQGTNVRWVWKPMRDVDAKNSGGASWQTWDGMGRISGTVYSKAIPERVLEKVACLLDEMKDAVFFVSDYEVVHPDPFLAVSTPKMLEDHKIFIVDQWDEPGFKDVPKPLAEPVSAPIADRIIASASRVQSLSGR